MIATIAAACGAIAGLGLFVAFLGVVGDDAPAQPRRPWLRRPEHPDRAVGRAGLALAAAAVVGALTHWPVAAIGTLALGVAGPSIFGGEAARRSAIERREALAAWADMLRDTLEAGRGLETAIAASATAAPAPIRDDVQLLAAELRTMARLDDALRRFAARVDDPTCDRIVAGLLLRRKNETLGEVLTAIATQARGDVEVRRRNDVEQGRVRWTARVIIGMTAAFAIGLAVVDRGFLAPYDSAGGQLALLVVASMIGVGYWSIARLCAEPPAPRLLRAEEPAPW